VRPLHTIRTLALVGVSSGLVLCPAAARAHEKWFYDSGPYPTRWSDVFAFPESAGALVAVALTIAAALAWRARRGRDLIPGPARLGATEAGHARFFASGAAGTTSGRAAA
jgi:hypothetical protein